LAWRPVRNDLSTPAGKREIELSQPALEELFKSRPTGPYDVALINSRSRGNWYDAAAGFFLRNSSVTR
jgi:hypothetical protein